MLDIELRKYSPWHWKKDPKREKQIHFIKIKYFWPVKEENNPAKRIKTKATVSEKMSANYMQVTTCVLWISDFFCLLKCVYIPSVRYTAGPFTNMNTQGKVDSAGTGTTPTLSSTAVSFRALCYVSFHVLSCPFMLFARPFATWTACQRRSGSGTHKLEDLGCFRKCMCSRSVTQYQLRCD